MKKKDLFLGGGILFAASVLFLVMKLMQYVQAKESGQKEIQEKLKQTQAKLAGSGGRGKSLKAKYRKDPKTAP